MNITYTMAAQITVADLFRLLNIPCNPCDARIRQRQITISPLRTEETRACNNSYPDLRTEVLKIELTEFRPNALPERRKHV